MLTKDLLNPILADDALTRGLGDPEARMLVEWLCEEADRTDADEGGVRSLSRWGRAVSRFVHLWCYAESHGAAIQLAASERFEWTLPATWVEPCELMEDILAAQNL